MPLPLKAELVAAAGNKCANPGCPTTRTHLHHIHEYAVYQTHDGKHMIAICPTCHDAVHHGPLRIDDDTLYAWKQIQRSPGRHGHLYVEPGDNPKLLLGSLAISTNRAVKVFRPSHRSRLAFRVVDGCILLLDASVPNLNGEEVIRVRDGHFQVLREDVSFQAAPGHLRATVAVSSEFIAHWALRQMQRRENDYAGDGLLTLLELEVLKPGLVRVKGLWCGHQSSVIITDRSLSFVSLGQLRPTTLVGDGERSVLNWAGPMNREMFATLESNLPPE